MIPTIKKNILLIVNTNKLCWNGHRKVSQIILCVLDPAEIIIKQEASAVQLPNLSTSLARTSHQRHSEQGEWTNTLSLHTLSLYKLCIY